MGETELEGPQGAAPARAEGAPAASEADAPRKVKKMSLRIVHQVPGRVRLKVRKGKSHPELLALYQDLFSKMPGVASVEARPDSGSLILHYDVRQEKVFSDQFGQLCQSHAIQGAAPRLGDEVEQIASKIEAEAKFLAERSEFAKNTVDFFKKVDYELKVSTDNVLDLKVVLVGGLAVYTFLELGAGAATPMWVTLGLFSLNHLAELQTQNHQAPAMVAARA